MEISMNKIFQALIALLILAASPSFGAEPATVAATDIGADAVWSGRVIV